MKFVDCHSHSLHYSFDATQSLEDLLIDARKQGLSGVCLTDHYDKDIVYEQGVENIFNLENYFRHLQLFRENQNRNEPKLLIGIELGWMPYLTDLYQNITKQWSFDSIVLSLHAMDGDHDIFMDRSVFSQGVEAAFSRALLQMVEMMQNVPQFNILGHYDYISRYVPGQVQRMNYQPLRDEFDALFKHLIENGKSLELNTRTIHKFLHSGLKDRDAWPDPAIYQRYRELGGELVSLSSDSHQSGQVGYLFAEAENYLIDAGFKAVTHFENQKAVLTPLI